jgi:hypothetical protein
MLKGGVLANAYRGTELHGAYNDNWTGWGFRKAAYMEYHVGYLAQKGAMLAEPLQIKIHHKDHGSASSNTFQPSSFFLFLCSKLGMICLPFSLAKTSVELYSDVLMPYSLSRLRCRYVYAPMS